MIDVQMDRLRILITGDFALRETAGLPGGVWSGADYDALVMEGSHAADNVYPTAASLTHIHALWDVCQTSIEKGASRLLILAQALGEAQAVYEALCQAQMQGKFPGLAIRMSGKAAKVASLYQQAISAPFSAWRLPLMTAEIHDYFPHHSIVIASGWEGQTDDEIRTRLGLSSAEIAILRPSQTRTQQDTYDFPLHASWGELYATALAVRCREVMLYHGTFNTPPSLMQCLEQCGRRISLLKNKLHTIGDVS